MRYAKGMNDGIVDALKIQTFDERREENYYCPECNTEVTFVWSQLGNKHFRHRQGYKPCILSSLTGRSNTGKWQWEIFMKVRKTLIKLLEKVTSIEKTSPLQWERRGARMYLLPSYTPERYLIQLNERVLTEEQKLLLLVPKIITAKDYDNINRYGNYRLKARAIYSYAYLYCIPRRLILTNGQTFYHLTNRRQVWSRNYGRYCKTLFDYEMREIGLNALLA